ncbi:exonuclease domain-containing protein [Streptomyces sp. NPDC007148]|uniref:exonuclease domain-containing protein n=1 Tax=Streptomyces sp. NPDC007148 TaxID=3364775 RepID=UPI0036942029
MSNFAEVRKAAWDTETTGTNPVEDRIVSAAFIVRGGDHQEHAFSWLINPGVPIPPEATELHRITDAMVQAKGQDPKTALDQIATNLARAIKWGFPLIAFNHSFDWSILHYELLRHGLPTVEDRVSGLPLPLIDPYVIDRHYVDRVRGKGQRKLKPTAERYRVQLTDWHAAKADALAALLIAEEQFARFGPLNAFTPPELFTAQQKWRAEQQAGLQEYLRKTDPDVVCDLEWPLIPNQRGGAA